MELIRDYYSSKRQRASRTKKGNCSEGQNVGSPYESRIVPLKRPLVEYELIDENFLVIPFLSVNMVDEGDIGNLKEILGEDIFCGISTYDANHYLVL